MIGSRSLVRQPAWLLVPAALLLLGIVGSRALPTVSSLTGAHSSVPVPRIAAPAAKEPQSGSTSATQRTITASQAQAPNAAAPATGEQLPVQGPPATTAQCPPQPNSGRPCAAP